MIITADMIYECRAKADGVIVTDRNDQPIVRSSIRYDGPDPLYGDDPGQVLVLRADDLTSVNPEDTDQEIAADLSQRWQDMVDEAWDQVEDR